MCLAGEACAGNHYLVRFQDRLAWIVVLERGATYCTINIKGLELQETSCHTVEAARIDDIFENALELREGCQRTVGKLNEYPMHTLTPVDACYLKAYSDARNVLTGIIDNPSASPDTMNGFLKSLVWVLLKYVKENKNRPVKNSQAEAVIRELSFVTKTEKHELKELNSNNNISNNGTILPQPTKKAGLQPLVPDFMRDTRSPTPPPANKSTSKQKKMASSWGSLDSFTDSIFSDDGAALKKQAKAIEPVHKPAIKRTVSPDIDDMLEDFNMGMPAFDVTRPKPQAQNKSGTKAFGNSIYKPQTNLAGSPDFKSPYSSQLSIPKEWRELPLDNSQVSRLVSKFPVDWFNHVLSSLELSSENASQEKVLKDIMGDDALRNCYAQLTMACYSIFESQGRLSRSGSSLNLWHF